MSSFACFSAVFASLFVVGLGDNCSIDFPKPKKRHYDEQFLVENFDDYTPLEQDLNPPSSLWLQRVS